MRFTHLLPLALSASAFLIPAEVKESVEIINEIPSSAKAETVSIECDGGCPVAVKTGRVMGWAAESTGKMKVDVSVEGNKVLFNGQQIWPRTVAPPLSIKQAVTDDKIISDVPVSTTMEYKPEEILVDQNTHMVIHPISIEFMALGNKVVHAESVEVRVAETEAGLGLLPSRIRAYESSPYTDSCTTIWCRINGILAKKFEEFRQATHTKINKWRGGCGGRKPGHKVHGLPPLKGGPAKFGPGSTLYHGGRVHGQHGQHGHHGHHRHRFSTLQTLLRSFFVGLSVGAIVGSIAFLITRTVQHLRGRPSREYIVVEQVDLEDGRPDGPPKYEEVYREPQVESEDEKKELLQ